METAERINGRTGCSAEALERLHAPQLIVAENRHADRLVETARSLRATRQQLFALLSARPSRSTVFAF